MPEHTLEELRKLATPALRHAELVTIARTKRPNEARYIAHNAGWPRRQVRAVKFLATLVRDYGSGALDALIISMEQVRAANAAPEQALEQSKMENRIRDRLKLITDPAHRLRLLIEHKLHDDATAFIEELIEKWTPFFYLSDLSPSSIGAHVATAEADTGEDKLVLVCHNHPDFDLQRHSKESVTEVMFTFAGMAKTLDWDEERKLRIVRSVLSRLIARDIPRCGYHWTVEGSVMACRTYLPSDDQLAKQVELWVLRYRFREGRLFEMRSRLPNPLKNAEKDRHELDPIVDRFVELGMAPADVRQEFLTRMREHSANCRPQFMLAMAGAKCFGWDDAERSDLLWESYIPELWSSLLEGKGDFKIRMMYEFLSLLTWKDRDARKEYLRSQLITLISKGRLARAYQLILLLGHHVGFFYAETEQSMFPDAEKYLKSLIPEAFTLAFDTGNYGVAAALVQHFGEESCYFEEAIEVQAEDLFRDRFEAIGKQYADVADKWDSGKSDKFFEQGRGKEWRDALSALEAERKAKGEELKAQRKQQISEVTQIAIDLKQPIRLETLVYYMAPKWPKY